MYLFVRAALAFCAVAALHITTVSANPAGDQRSGAHAFSPSAHASGRLNYDLAAVRRGDEAVPAVFATRLPSELPKIRETRQKKRTFIRLVLPLILESNARIEAKREYLSDLAVKPTLTAGEQHWLRELALDYGVDPADPKMIAKLLRRVDIIPPSLAIAQSITESGWGTSRFAQKGRALYGQRTWSRGGGIIPKQRRSGETYEVRAFRSLLESVESYMRNLNTHPAYASLRARRAADRDIGRQLSGHALAEGLDRYAETGEQYVREIQTLIRVNRLGDFDDASFRIEDDQVASL